MPLNSSTRVRRPMATILILALSTGIALVLCEGLLRLRYADPIWKPSSEVEAVQEHLTLDTAIGFTWKPDANAEDDLVFTLNDIQFPPHSTGRQGFINHPDAIAMRKKGEKADVVAVGDSFMEMASHALFTLFRDEGLRFYSYAIHRQAPPQFSITVQQRALPLEPKWVLYALFENDFWETEDHENWRRSGLDWFSFHSGRWCGPPLAPEATARLRRKYLAGFTGLYHALNRRVRGEKMSVTGPSKETVERVIQEILNTHSLLKEEGIGMVTVFIPSRATAVDKPTFEAKAYDAIIARLETRGVSILDLRPTFRNHPQPASLYYKTDAHWNNEGIALAVKSIVGHIRQAPPRDESDDASK